MEKFYNTQNLIWFGRVALFLDYFWFGVLKIVGTSPATELVLELQRITLPFISPSIFIVAFGFVECLIGISLLIPKITKYAYPVMLLHMLATFLPLILLPALTWQGFLQPTLIGQYILKNVVLIALALMIYSNHVKPRN